MEPYTTETESDLYDLKLEVLKLELECEKLALELDNLKKPWWRKATSWGIVVPLVAAAIGGGVTYYTSSRVDASQLSPADQQAVLNEGKLVGTENEVSQQAVSRAQLLRALKETD